MNIFKQLLKSLYSPKDIAKFRFQGIGKTIFYVFLLTLLSILPTTYHLVTDINMGNEVTKETLKEEVPPFSFENGQLSLDSSTPVIIGSYVFSSGIKFIEVSILALIGLFIKNLLHRNAPYRQNWRMAAYSVTLPTLFSTLMALLEISVPYAFLINLFVSIIVLTLAIKEIPMKKQKLVAP